MTTRAGKILAGAFALVIAGPVAGASAQELSEKAVKSFMDYAWSLTPQQFSKPDGTVIQIDKKKREEVMVPLDTARDVIKVGRLSAHAQVCNLQDHQTANHHSMMQREIGKSKWTPQQLVFISQLHLTTVMLLTGKIRLVEKDGDKEVVVEEEKQAPVQTCTDEQRTKVKEMIAAYVKESPGSKEATGAAPAKPAAGAAPAAAATAKADATTTGSTTTPAPKPQAAPAAKTPAPAAAPAAKAPAPAEKK